MTAFPRLASAAGLLLGLLLLGWLVMPVLDRPFHADEAVQWSLLEGDRPHSATDDRLHGPLLLAVARPVLAAADLSPREVGAAQLRAIPLVWTLLLVLALPWVAPPAWGMARNPAVLFLLPLAALPAARFIQEWMMASSLMLASVLWLRAEVAPSGARWRLAAGAFAGLALACKVSALAPLAFGALAFHLLGHRPGARAWSLALGSGLVAWASVQSSLFSDLPALGTWFVQLVRSLGLATGLGEPALPMGSPVPWVLTGATLGLVLVLRHVARAALGRPGTADLDPLLAAATGLCLFHLALPYKTPWLLATIDLLAVAVLLPRLAAALPSPCLRRALPLAAAILLAALPAVGSTRRYDYVETSEDVPRLAAAIHRLASEAPGDLPITVEEGHAWPLPFHLRDRAVAYRAMPDDVGVALRLMVARSPEAPRVAGYRAFPFRMRPGELWWALVRDSRADAFDRAWEGADPAR